MRIFRNYFLPVMILAPLLALLTGCFYMPWFEHRIDKGPNIRAEIGPPDSKRAIRPGHATRAQVLSFLGQPEYESVDGLALGYIARTRNGFWVWPLCFTTTPTNDKAYAVRLVFDKDGLLQRFDWDEADYPYSPLLMSGYPVDDIAVQKLNEKGGPQLLEIRNGSVTTQP